MGQAHRLDGLYSERDKRRGYGQAHPLDTLSRYLGVDQNLKLIDPVNDIREFSNSYFRHLCGSQVVMGNKWSDLTIPWSEVDNWLVSLTPHSLSGQMDQAIHSIG